MNKTVVKVKKFSDYEMTNGIDFSSFEKWKKSKPSIKIEMIVPVPKTYVDVEYIVTYSEIEEQTHD